MRKEEMKMKVKNFAEEHKKELKIAAGAGLVVVGACVGWKTCVKLNGLKDGDLIVHNKDIIGLFADAKASYPNKANMVIGKVETPLKMADLGALGDKMKDWGCVDANGITHFLMFGDGEGFVK